MRPHRSIRTRYPTTVVVRIGPDTLRCGLCKTEIQAPYKSGIPAPCGSCDWLWYGNVLVATPNRAAALERILARNRRRAQAQASNQAP